MLVDLFDIDTPTLDFKISPRSLNRTLIGHIDSNNMRPPFYIVPIVPEDPDTFNKHIFINVETGNIYTNTIIDPERFDTFKFSALSINEGLAITITITVTKEIALTSPITTTKATIIIATTLAHNTVQTLPAIEIFKKKIPAEVKLSNSTAATSINEPKNRHGISILTENIKVLVIILVASVVILMSILYGSFFLIRKNHNQKQRRLMSNKSASNERFSFACTSSTNLTFKQELERNNKSYLNKFINCIRADDGVVQPNCTKSTTLISIADSMRKQGLHDSSGDNQEIFQDNLIIRPSQSLFTYSDGYLNDMGKL